MRRLYTLVMYALLPWIMVRLCWKSRRAPMYRQRMLERLSLGKSLPTAVDVWVHAVSMGEVVAATPLIEKMLEKRLRVLVTTMTPTGSQQVLTRFQSEVSHQYIPYDLPWCLRRFFRRTSPKIGIIMETELWPNMIHYACLNPMSLILVNARLSDKAYVSYFKFRRFFATILPKFSWIGVQSLIDKERYISLGAIPSKLEIAGNMKFDVPILDLNTHHFDHLKRAWGIERPVWIAASTHEHEEVLLLAQFERIKAVIPNLLLLIAPRRPERFQMVYDLVRQQGWSTGLRSQPETISAHIDILVLDSMGELLSFYALSDYAFVGGSLVPIGGHNVLEPIAMRVPVFSGPFMQNSKAVCAQLVDHNAMTICQSAEEVADTLIELHLNASKRQKQIAEATAVLEANRGAVDRYWAKIEDLLS